jgi:hypothetical protein
VDRFRCLAFRQARWDDTRRKILVGAVILAKIERGELDEKELKAMLDSVLTRCSGQHELGVPLRAADPCVKY